MGGVPLGGDPPAGGDRPSPPSSDLRRLRGVGSDAGITADMLCVRDRSTTVGAVSRADGTCRGRPVAARAVREVAPCPGRLPYEPLQIAWAALRLRLVSGVVADVSCPTMAACRSTWATCSATGASERAQFGICSASSWVSGVRSRTWPSGDLDELDLAECAALDQMEHVALDLGSYRLDEIQRHRLAALGIAVDNAETGVESYRLASEDGLRLQEPDSSS